MRVISGTAKGRALKAVPGDSTRPILDRAKVPLFDILRSFVPDKQILDLFGGTGQIGIEALSLGASHCVFCDTNARAIAMATWPAPDGRRRPERVHTQVAQGHLTSAKEVGLTLACCGENPLTGHHVANSRIVGLSTLHHRRHCMERRSFVQGAGLAGVGFSRRRPV